MESGETFGVCTKRKLSAVSIYSNFSNISLQEDNHIFNRISNDVNDINNSSNDRNINAKDSETQKDIGDVNTANIEMNLPSSETNFSHLTIDEVPSVSTYSQVTNLASFDETMGKNQSRSLRSVPIFDTLSLATTADTVYSNHSARPSLIGDRPLKVQDYCFAAAAFICHLFTVGIAVSIGVIVIEWLHDFPDSRTTLLAVPPLIFGIASAIGLFVGSLINQIGGPSVIIIGGFFQGLMMLVSAFASSAFFLFVSIGICFAIGCSLVYVTIFVVVGIYFGNRATIFISILSTAGPIGGVLFPLIIPQIINFYSWSSCLFIMSGLCFNICPLGLFLLACQNQANKVIKRNFFYFPFKLRASKKLLDFTVFQNTKFNLFLLPLCLSAGHMNLTMSIYASFLDTKGFTLVEATQLLSILCSASIIVRLAIGILLRLTGWRFVYLYSLISIGFGISVCLLTIFTSYKALAICSVFVGLLHGGPCGLYPIVILDFVGPEKYSSAIGITETANGLVTIIEGFLIGFLANLTGTYNLAFYIFGGACIFFNFLFLIILIVQYLKDKKINFKLF